MKVEILHLNDGNFADKFCHDNGSPFSPQEIAELGSTVVRLASDDAFMKWCKENDYKPKYLKLPAFAREAFSDVALVTIENMSGRMILKMVLEYHGIIGYTDSILGVLDSLGMLNDNQKEV